MQEQLKNNQQLSRPLDRNSPMLRQQDLKNMLDRLESMARSGAKEAARELLPICWSPPKFFHSPSPFPLCAGRSNAKASIVTAWQ